MNDFFNELNKEQYEAVSSTEGYVRVIAGAGSGKTRALTSRYVYIIDKLGVMPENVLSVTFTNKAANEIRKRVHDYVGDNDTSYICTFHGLCNKILKQEMSYLNWPSTYMIMDEEDQKQVLSEIYEETGLTLKDHNYNYYLNIIGKYKDDAMDNYVSFLTNPEGYKFVDKKDSKKEDNNVIQKYLIKQRKNYMLDYDDLLYFVLTLFNTQPKVLKKWQEQFQYIQVDEFQDVSDAEFRLVTLLSNIHKNLFVVGDPDQTIYSWRGANIQIILDFDKSFANVKTLYMSKNYRSTPDIIDVSNSLIKHNTIRLDKDLVPIINKNDNRVVFNHAKDRTEEGKWIASKIQDLILQGVELSNIAVLYRSNFLSRFIEESLIQKSIPYVIFNGMEFYKRSEIKDCIAYLRMIEYGDDLSFMRTINMPARGIGKKRIEYLKSQQAFNGKSLYYNLVKNIENPLFKGTKALEYIALIDNLIINKSNFGILDLLDQVLKKSHYEELLMTNGDHERLNNITELKDAIKTYLYESGETIYLDEYLNRIALISNVDSKDKKDTVKLMTVHTAKGLEFEYVFVCALNEGVFPSAKIKDEDAMEEERRIAYVAFTRAKKGLFISDADGFLANVGSLTPSRFVFEIKKDLFERIGIPDDLFDKVNDARDLSNKAKDSSVRPEFDIMDRVSHEVFGEGIVSEVNLEGKYYKVLFENGIYRNISFKFQLKKI